MIALFPLPARREARLTLSIEPALLVALAVVVTILPNLAKFGFDIDRQTGSPIGTTVWTLMYFGALVRLHQLGALKRSVSRALLLSVLCGLAILSTVWSVNATVTLRNSVELGGTCAMGFYVAARFGLRDCVRLFGASLFTIGVICILAQALDGDGLLVPWSGIYAEKNHFGGAMTIAAITFLIAAVDARGSLRGVFLAGLAFSIFCVIKSTSVTSLSILTLSFAVIFLVLAFRRTRLPPLALLGSLGIAAGFAWLVSSVINIGELIESFGKSTTLTGRTDIWPLVWDAILEKPLLGYGYNGYFSDGGPADLIRPIAHWRPFHAHNSFLQMGTSVGLLGLALFVTVVAIGFWRSLVLATRGEVVTIWPFAMIAYLTFVSFSETYLGVQNSSEMIIFAAAVLYASPDWSRGDAAKNS